MLNSYRCQHFNCYHCQHCVKLHILLGLFVYNTITANSLLQKAVLCTEISKRHCSPLKPQLRIKALGSRLYQEPFHDFHQFHKLEDLISVDHSITKTHFGCSFSNTGKGPRFCSTCKLTSQSAAVSRYCRNTRAPGSETKASTIYGTANIMHISTSASVPFASKSHGVTWMDTQFPHTEWGASYNRNPELRTPEPFIVGSKQAYCVLWRETLSSGSQSFHCTYILGKTVWNKGQSGPLFIRCLQMPETMVNGLPTFTQVLPFWFAIC